MAGSESFCLRLNGFEGNAKIYWQKLQTEKDFFDVTLACDDKQIKTHKLVLSSCSPVLRNILKLNQTLHPIIYFRKVGYRILQNLLDFMYQGEVDVAEEDLPSFLEVAADLNIRGLCERNTDDCDSKQMDTSQLTKQNIDPSPKRKITPKIEKIENVNNYNSIDQKYEFGKALDSLVRNSNDIIKFHASNKVISKESNQECADEDEKTVISTVESSDAERSFSCGQCDFKTKFTNGLKQHIKSVHEGVRYPCEQCGYKAKYKPDLQKHEKSIHEGERYPCNQCDYKATQKYHLRNHQLKKH